MPSKTSTSKTSKTASAPAKATKAKAKANKAKTSGKSADAKTSAKASTPAPTPAPTPATPPPVVSEASTVSTASTTSTAVPEISLDARFESIMTRLAEFKTFQATLHNDVKVLRREVTRQMREANKKRRRKAPATDDPNKPPRAPSGFAKPTLISDELCTFLGKPSGTEMARTEVTKSITAYIKEHSLQHADNKRRIIPDPALKSLLNVDDTTELTYFNLQKYMKVHFPKSAAALAAAAVTSA
jgi:upstream activation factor subunit UAF30